jgi:hypothetical protein
MAGTPNPGAPIVFISSTIEDLREYRQAAAAGCRRGRTTQRASPGWKCERAVSNQQDLLPFILNDKCGWPDDGRYLEVRDSVMGIFEREGARRVAVEDRIAAAEALGEAGDPRLVRSPPPLRQYRFSVVLCVPHSVR